MENARWAGAFRENYFTRRQQDAKSYLRHLFSLLGCRFAAFYQPSNVVFHNRFAALIFYPLAIANNPPAARGNRLDIEHFDLDTDRVVDLNRAEQAHFVEAGERHSGAVDQSRLDRQSLGHPERQASRCDALAVETFVANIFHIQKQRLGETDQSDKL